VDKSKLEPRDFTVLSGSWLQHKQSKPATWWDAGQWNANLEWHQLAANACWRRWFHRHRSGEPDRYLVRELPRPLREQDSERQHPVERDQWANLEPQNKWLPCATRRKPRLRSWSPLYRPLRHGPFEPPQAAGRSGHAISQHRWRGSVARHRRSSGVPRQREGCDFRHHHLFRSDQCRTLSCRVGVRARLPDDQRLQLVSDLDGAFSRPVHAMAHPTRVPGRRHHLCKRRRRPDGNPAPLQTRPRRPDLDQHPG